MTRQLLASGHVDSDGTLIMQGDEGGVTSSEQLATGSYRINLATACDRGECLPFAVSTNGNVGGDPEPEPDPEPEGDSGGDEIDPGPEPDPDPEPTGVGVAANVILSADDNALYVQFNASPVLRADTPFYFWIWKVR